MSEHPMAEGLRAYIAVAGPDNALTWWLRYGIEWEGDEPRHYCEEAIKAMARGDVDFVLIDPEGNDLARAFQWVGIFGLEPFVEAERVAPTL